MKVADATEELSRSIARLDPLPALRRKLIDCRDAGVSREETLAVLRDLRSRAGDEALEDRILEVMDLATGFCGPEQAIWPD